MSALVHLPQQTLAPDEARLLAEFRSMNPWARGLLFEIAQGFVEDFPGAKSAPAVDDAQVVFSRVDYCNPITNRSADNVEIDQP